MPSKNSLPLDTLASIIRSRRTSKPALFEGGPSPTFVRNLIDIARHAPNHHRTEPARFYLLDSQRIHLVGRLFAEIVRGDGSEPSLLKKADRKAQEWGKAPGLLIVTCHSDKSSVLAQKNPLVTQEDYATVSCICQNLLLLMQNEGISTKWSTGQVWKHPDFAKAINMGNPTLEKVVALIFYGYSKEHIDARTLAPLDDHLVNFHAKVED